MNIINKFKSAYLQKLIQGHFANNEINELHSLIAKEISNPYIVEPLKSIIQNNIEGLEQSKLFKNNIYWVNSFDLDDTIYINQFLEFYFAKKNLNISPISNYPMRLSKIFYHLFQNKKKLDFIDLINNSYLYQYLISLEQSNNTIFINSASAFFSSNQNSFTHHQLTSSYIYLVRNPLSLYTKYFSKYNDHQAVLNTLFNFDGMPKGHHYEINKKNIVIEENSQSWSVNVNSWIDSNVMNTFRGIVIKIEELIEKPDEILADIISHLSLSLPNLSLDYQIIIEFLDNNPISNNLVPFKISNKQKKIILREMAQFKSIETLHYEI
tara:strand:+ start:2027 stop:2998 length:972 start_codon:yes stop_codon:yes gene_type:complete